MRAVACWRANSPYILKDTDGTPITTAQGRQIVNDRYQIDPDKTRGQTKNRKAQHHKKRDERGVTEVAQRSNIPTRPHQS